MGQPRLLDVQTVLDGVAGELDPVIGGDISVTGKLLVDSQRVARQWIELFDLRAVGCATEGRRCRAVSESLGSTLTAVDGTWQIAARVQANTHLSAAHRWNATVCSSNPNKPAFAWGPKVQAVWEPQLEAPAKAVPGKKAAYTIRVAAGYAGAPVRLQWLHDGRWAIAKGQLVEATHGLCATLTAKLPAGKRQVRAYIPKFVSPVVDGPEVLQDVIEAGYSQSKTMTITR